MRRGGWGGGGGGGGGTRCRLRTLAVAHSLPSGIPVRQRGVSTLRVYAHRSTMLAPPPRSHTCPRPSHHISAPFSCPSTRHVRFTSCARNARIARHGTRHTPCRCERAHCACASSPAHAQSRHKCRIVSFLPVNGPPGQLFSVVNRPPLWKLRILQTFCIGDNRPGVTFAIFVTFRGGGSTLHWVGGGGGGGGSGPGGPFSKDS